MIERPPSSVTPSTAPEPISDPNYWARRITDAKVSDHHSIYLCGIEEWRKIEARHRQILRGLIHPDDSILDVGCGYGRLLTLLPRSWVGNYLGIDLCPEFVAKARKEHPDRRSSFVVMNVLDLPGANPDAGVHFDWAVLVSIKQMMLRNLPPENWVRVEGIIKKAARRVLLLEYDDADGGEVLE